MNDWLGGGYAASWRRSGNLNCTVGLLLCVWSADMQVGRMDATSLAAACRETTSYSYCNGVSLKDISATEDSEDIGASGA